MMKRLLAFILLITYFTASTGFVVVRHYCMDRFTSAQIGADTNEKCAKCGMHKSDGCCRDEVKVVKLQTSHLAGSINTEISPAPVAILTTQEFTQPSFFFLNHTELPVAHGPPLGSDQELYLQNCVFRL